MGKGVRVMEIKILTQGRDKLIAVESIINTAFSEQKPYLVINTMQTQSEKDEHNGFRFLILGVQTMFRNPISHEAKINWEISGQDGLDILTTISLIHRKLDLAVRIYPNHS